MRHGRRGVILTRRISVKPNESGWAYTIPTIRFPDGTYVMDSKKIAEEIEAKHPSPSLHLDSGYQPRMEQLVGPLVNTLFGVFIAELPKQVLNPRSVEYWNDDRANIVGMPVEQHEREHGGQKAIENGAESLRKITGLYKEETAGPFLTGETPIYADFVWVSFLVFMKRANPAWWGSLLEATGDSALHEGLIKASEPWLKRNDH